MPLVNSKFGLVPKESALSYQQKLESGCMISLYVEPSYPDLPQNNVMYNAFSVVLNNKQSVTMEGLQFRMAEMQRFEEQTRLQSRVLCGTKYEVTG